MAEIADKDIARRLRAVTGGNSIDGRKLVSVGSLVNACYAARGETSPYTFRDWARRLRGVTAGLSDLGRRTEGEFLSVGESLREVHARAETVAGKASSAATLISGAEIIAAITGLRGMVKRMNDFLTRSGSEAARNAEALRRVGRILGEVRGPLTEFRKVVRSLRVLGISTKIESARLGQGSSDFRSLAENVLDLSALIENKSDDIMGRGKDLGASVGDTLSRVLDHEAALRERARAILADASTSLAALVEAHDKGVDTVKAVSQRSLEIAGNIGVVVTSMQFHDITRQQIEHVVHAFGDLDAEFAAVSGGWPRAPSADRRRVAGLAGDICALQAAHLESAGRSFATAVDNVVRSLRGIARSADDIAGEAGRMAGSVDRTGQTALSATERGLSSVVSALKESAEAGRDLAGSVRSAADTIEEMSTFVSDIEEIGIEIEMVALNAVVKAAHAGERGAALGVLAESIQKLSADSRRQATAIADALREFRSAAGVLRSSAVPGGRDDPPDPEVDGMVHDLGRLLSSLQAVNVSVGLRLSGLDDSARSLSADIETIVGAITVHRVVSGVIAEVVKDVGAIERQARSLAPAARRVFEAGALGSLARRYTMQKERKVHLSVTGIAPDAAGSPAVCGGSGGNGSGGNGSGGNGKDEEHLGTNVELF